MSRRGLVPFLALAAFVLFSAPSSLAQSSGPCRGPLDISVVSNVLDSDLNAETLFYEDRALLAALPAALKPNGSLNEPLDRYGWFGWAGADHNIEDQALRITPFGLAEATVDRLDLISTTEFTPVEPNGVIDPSAGIGTAYLNWLRGRDPRGALVYDVEVEAALRCVILLRYDGNTDYATNQLGEFLILSRDDDKCFTLLWGNSDAPEAYQETIRLGGLAQVSTTPSLASKPELLPTGWGTQETDYYFFTNWTLPPEEQELDLVVEKILNSARYRDLYCNADFYAWESTDGFTNLAIILLIGFTSIYCLFFCCQGLRDRLNPARVARRKAINEAKANGKPSPFHKDGDKVVKPGCFGWIRVAYFRILLSFEAALQRRFYALGKFIVRHPRKLILITFTIAVLGGLLAIDLYYTPGSNVLITDPQQNWASPNSLAADAALFLGSEFELGTVIPRVKATMIFRLNVTTDTNPRYDDPEQALEYSILTPEALAAIAQVEWDLEHHPEYANKSSGGDVIPVCFFAKDPTSCVRYSPLDYWRHNISDYESLLVETDFSTDSTALFDLTFNEAARSSAGGPIFRPDVFRSPLRSWDCFTVNPVDGTRRVDTTCGGKWQLDGSPAVSQWDGHCNCTTHARTTYFRIPSGSSDWDRYFAEYELPPNSPIEIVARGNEDELGDIISQSANELPINLFIITGLAIVAYIAKVFVRRSIVASRIFLGLSGLTGTGLSLAAGMGWLVYFGDTLSITSAIVPVVIVSIGVDDMFLIVDAFDETPVSAPLSQRVPEALQAAGLAMTMTTTTDALAFAVGMGSPLPAVASMSKFAFVCVVVDFIFQLLFFVPMLVLDVRRQARKSADCSLLLMIFGCLSKDALCTSQDAVIEPKNSTKKPEANAEANDEHHHEGSKIFACIGRAVSGKWCRLAVFIIFFTLSVAGIATVTSVDIGLNLADTIIPSTTLGQFYAEERSFFEEPVTVPADFLHQNSLVPTVNGVTLQLPSPEAQRTLLSGFEESMEADFLVPGSFISFWPPFSAWFRNNTLSNATVVDPAPGFLAEGSWIPTLEEFLALGFNDTESLDIDPEEVSSLGEVANLTLADIFDRDLLRSADNPYIASHTMGLLLPLSNIGWSSVNVLEQLYILFRETGWAAFSPDMILFEANLQVIPSLIQDTVSTMIIVLVVTVLFLQHPSASLILVVTLMSVVAQVILAFRFFSISLNSFSEVTLVIALGLSIDYISHIAHAYVSAPGDRSAKVIHALAAHGPAIANGAFTTIAGMLTLLLIGHINIIRVFGLIILIVQVVGLLHAFILLPAIMSWIGPLTFRNPVTQVLAANNTIKVRPSGALDLTEVDDIAVNAVSAGDIEEADRGAVAAAASFHKAASQARLLRSLSTSDIVVDTPEGAIETGVVDFRYKSVRIAPITGPAGDSSVAPEGQEMKKTKKTKKTKKATSETSAV